MCWDKKKFSVCQYSWEDWTGILTIHQVPTWEERTYSIPTAKLTLPGHFLRGNTENIPLYSQLQSHTKEFISLKKYLWPTKNYSSSDLICKPNTLRMKSMTKRIICELLWRQTNTVHAMNSSDSLFTVRPFIHFCYSTKGVTWHVPDAAALTRGNRVATIVSLSAGAGSSAVQKSL